MFYEIIKKTGVLKEGTPFIIDEKKDLVIEFLNLPEGDFYAKIGDGKLKNQVIHVEDGKITVSRTKLSAGIWYLELQKVENAQAVDKIICTPIIVKSIAAQTTGLIAYPDIESVIEQIAELTKIVNDLADWAQKVNPMIHEHKITK